MTSTTTVTILVVDGVAPTGRDPSSVSNGAGAGRWGLGGWLAAPVERAGGQPMRQVGAAMSVAFTSVAGEALHIKQQSTGQVFTNADALSEYLLIPVLTGRPL